RRSYTDTFREPLCQTLHHAVLHAACGEADRVRDRPPAGVSVRDHGEPLQAEQVGAAVGVRVELRPETARGRPDQEAPELSLRGRGDLLAERVQELLDRPLEELQ